ncbi:MAG TPA: family 20 glycosylhydrolase, partial [Bacteroidia bacterium]|nr:family 20 glycosylhydrolase [Bacteroidia bacterium]
QANKISFPVEGLNVVVDREGKLELHEDESYTLLVTPSRMMLEAVTDIGALRGLETALQLLSVDADGFYFPACRIEDAPRFPWRGLLIDVCRHWQPVEVIKRNLDAMAAMKMNVLHWHLSEDQGFRIESKRFPQLHLLGSNGDFFTQEQVRDIIAYAGARGIRVVPEFDIPGHSTAWFVGHPELASAPGPYTIEKKFGVFDPAMNPANEATYTFLTEFLAEMSALFPDAYFHIGGDENEGKQWDKNAEVNQLKKDKGLKDNHAVQAYFNQRLLEILTENRKRMVGWDEILQPGMPTNIVIQSWRGKEALINAAKAGYDVMLSSGYYIDLCQSASFHYGHDPIPADAALDAKAQAHVLGGEATMWAELVSPETIDSRIWPRTCAIAERLWSPAEVRDVADMYRRLRKASRDLEELGILHLRYAEVLMRRALRSESTGPLRTLCSVIAPVQGYKRHNQGIAYTTETPLTRLPDMAVPDPELPREFASAVESMLAKPDLLQALVVRNWLDVFRNNHKELEDQAVQAPAIRPILPLSQQLLDLSVVGIGLLEMLEKGESDLVRKDQYRLTIEKARTPVQECEIQIVDAIAKMWDNVYGK